MAFKMPKSPLACVRLAASRQQLFVLLLLGALAVAQARAGPEANPKPKAQNEVENYNETTIKHLKMITINVLLLV